MGYHPQDESVKYSSSLPESQMEDKLNKARRRLKITSKLITNFLNLKYKDENVPDTTNNFFYHWLEDDLTFADRAEDLVRELQDTIKRSYALALAKVLDPSSLGARPKDTYIYKNQTKQIHNAGLNQSSDTAQETRSRQAETSASHQKIYPQCPLEEEAAPAPERTVDWVNVSKFEDSWKEDTKQDNLDQKRSVTFDMASGQPPDYVQTMRMKQVGPQQTNQYQQGYNLYNQDLTNLVQQQQLMRVLLVNSNS